MIRPGEPLDASNLDPAADPGTDFYRYANGGWLDANPVPPEYGSWGSFNEVHQRNEELLRGLLEAAGARSGGPGTATRLAGDYFASGMDSAQIEAHGTAPIGRYLDAIDALSSPADSGGLAALLHPIGVGFLFGARVEPDFEDSTAHLLYVGQGGLGLPERDYYLRSDERSQELRVAYHDHVAAQLFNSGSSRPQAQEQTAAILQFETSLAEKSFTAAQLRDVDLILNKTSADDLEAMVDSFSFRGYLEGLEAVVQDVNVDNPAFFVALSSLVAETPIETLRAYARWHLIRATASALPAVFADEAFAFYGTTLAGRKEQKERWKRVLDAATGEIGEVVAELYVSAAFSPEAKTRCELMVDDLLGAMEGSIDGLDWMSDETKAKALSKLRGFTYKIGYPDVWRDRGGLVIDRGPWAENRLRTRAFEHDRNLRKLGEPVDEHEWAMPAHVVNAYYHPLRNEVVFPAGILQPPFFYLSADDAANYGAIGAVIGHEITHGFDDEGSKFDANGNLENWWSDDDRAEFERRGDQVVEQFSKCEVQDGLFVNGELTLGENIADLGGVTIAFAALEATLDGKPLPLVGGLTPQQRFFLSYATVWRRNATDEHLRLQVTTDPHAPAPLRCNMPLGNFEPFALAFSLEEGAPIMRGRDERVAIW